jgi:signal transduction histidine kinase
MPKRSKHRGSRPTALKTGTATFRPRARIIQTLGRDLISNEFIAIQELIKNAYDADATNVIVAFEDPLSPGQGAIEISDNGDGMTLHTIQTAWMEPATVSKLAQRKTRKGRRVTGEKGIGRFAAARVARILEIASVPRGGKEQVQARFDWGAFEDQSKYLDQIRCTWQVAAAPPRTPHGTRLRLISLNDEWNEDERHGISSFTDLRAELSRLVAPLAKDEFTIEFRLPERFQSFAGIVTPPEVLGKPHYQLKGRMDGAGRLAAQYDGPNGRKKLRTDGKRPVVRVQGGRIPSCGPFKFEFRVWDRQPEDLEPLAREFGSTVRNIRRDLDAASGVSVYRDRFRVLVPENDWLRLDLRRVQNPTLRLSNNQVVARIFISADDNPGLKDQTNRQGIVDSQQLEDFKAALKDILSRLEVERDAVRRAKKPEPSTAGVFQKLQIAPIRAFLIARYPDDKELKDYLEGAIQTHDEGIGEVQQVLARYRRLATLGQLVDVVLHEGRTPVATIKNEVELAETQLGDGGDPTTNDRLRKRFTVITEQTEVLTLLFKRLAPFSGRKRGRPVATTIEKLIADTFELHAQHLKDLKVSIDLPGGSTPVTTDPSEMQMIFLNLLENSLYWLEKQPEDRRRIAVQVKTSDNGADVTFSDSGPGVAEDVRDRIFDPYFSTKPEGVGLGLTIAGETAAEYDGTLELLSSGPLPGATFRVRLRTGIGANNGN